MRDSIMASDIIITMMLGNEITSLQKKEKRTRLSHSEVEDQVLKHMPIRGFAVEADLRWSVVLADSAAHC
jgi:hypothetical protein